MTIDHRRGLRMRDKLKQYSESIDGVKVEIGVIVIEVVLIVLRSSVDRLIEVLVDFPD